MFVQADWWKKKLKAGFSVPKAMCPDIFTSQITATEQYNRKFSVHMTRAHGHSRGGVHQGLKHLVIESTRF